MLSGRTTDEQVDITYNILLQNKLSVEAVVDWDESKLYSMISGVSGAQNKAKYVTPHSNSHNSLTLGHTVQVSH